MLLFENSVYNVPCDKGEYRGHIVIYDKHWIKKAFGLIGKVKLFEKHHPNKHKYFNKNSRLFIFTSRFFILLANINTKDEIT